MGKLCMPNQSRGLLRVLRIIITAMKYNKKNNKNNSFNHLINSDDTGIRDACSGVLSGTWEDWSLERLHDWTRAVYDDDWYLEVQGT